MLTAPNQSQNGHPCRSSEQSYETPEVCFVTMYVPHTQFFLGGSEAAQMSFTESRNLHTAQLRSRRLKSNDKRVEVCVVTAKTNFVFSKKIHCSMVRYGNNEQSLNDINVC